tara:strand:+ start:1762 stop:2439 length:678 start_codon:yes stop_codon:yes gene_type:complete
MRQLIDKKNKIVLYLIFLLILSSISNKNIKNQKNYSSTINKIHVTGLANNKNLQIVNKLNDLFYKNIFIVSKEEIIKIMSEFNIVEEYVVKKVYPSKLDINIKPTKIIAKISGNNALSVGSNGKLILTENVNNSLPYMFGEFKSKAFLEFKENIQDSEFNFTDIKSIFYYPSNRWDIITTNNVLIKLPEKELSNSLDFAYKIITNQLFENNKLIDLRISNHLIMQ